MNRRDLIKTSLAALVIPFLGLPKARAERLLRRFFQPWPLMCTNCGGGKAIHFTDGKRDDSPPSDITNLSSFSPNTDHIYDTICLKCISINVQPNRRSHVLI